MSSDLLTKARNYEKEHGSLIRADERPLFHVTPYVGWLNDPNGFSTYKGEYHLFYQYYPYDINWGPMHWGHVKSRDLLKWEWLPASLSPDMEYDAQGCFSGSGIELPDGQHLLVYTSVHGKDNTPICRQNQCLALGDGLNYKKYENNPVITGAMLPEGSSPSDFRDPKIWFDKKDNLYYMVAGNRTSDGSGAILLFSSANALDWKYVTTLDRCNNEYGKMWECPDFFESGGKYLLLISPQEMRAEGMKFHNGNDIICLVGTYDRQNHVFTREDVLAVDYGLDLYASQTLETDDGRRIMTAWMQSWESSHFHPPGAKWAGMLSLPRELTFVDGQLIQNPVRELLAYRTDPVIHNMPNLTGRQTLPGISGRTLDMTLDISPASDELFREFIINVAENEEYRTFLSYDPHENTVCIDRTDSGFRYNIVSRRKAPVRNQNGKINLRIIMDRFSIEVFINGGEQVMSACLYTPQEADGISFEAKGCAAFHIEKYDIKIS